jgi:hypothetical protein
MLKASLKHPGMFALVILKMSYFREDLDRKRRPDSVGFVVYTFLRSCRPAVWMWWWQMKYLHDLKKANCFGTLCAVLAALRNDGIKICKRQMSMLVLISCLCIKYTSCVLPGVKYSFSMNKQIHCICNNLVPNGGNVLLKIMSLEYDRIST